eukprot:869527-Amphidinium_carterae.1
MRRSPSLKRMKNLMPQKRLVRLNASTSEDETSVDGAMAYVTEITSEEEAQPQAYATSTKTPMFLDPVGKAYALADS